MNGKLPSEAVVHIIMESTKSQDGEAHQTAKPNAEILLQYLFHLFIYVLTNINQFVRHLSCELSFREHYEIMH